MSFKHFVIPLLVCYFLLTPTTALDNGLALTPILGWNSWNQFQCNISEKLILQTIDALISSGLKDAGYQYIILDDCWQAPTRDEDGNLQADSTRFPSGIPFLSNYAHQRGVKLGIYSDVGHKTCQKFPGSYQHYQQDADTFAKWGIDFLKLDFCSLAADQWVEPWKYYEEMSIALNKTGRPIVFSICNWGYKQPWKWAPKIANMWRTTMDIYPYHQHVMHILHSQKDYAEFAGPGHWNDPDMIEVGVNGTIGNRPFAPKTRLTEAESVTHFSLWSIVSAPLILGNDLRSIPDWVFHIIANKEVIAVNQDKLGIQGILLNQTVKGVVEGICFEIHCVHTEVFVKPLQSVDYEKTGKFDTFAVVLLNRGFDLTYAEPQFRPETVTVGFRDVLNKFNGGLTDSNDVTMTVRDLWAKKDLGVFTNSFSSPQPIAPHSCMMITLSMHNTKPT